MKKRIISLIAVAAMAIILPVSIMAQNKDDAQLKRAILKVDNLTCGGCFDNINQSLESIDGFSGFGANLFRRIVGVDFSSPMTPEIIAKTISDAGYPATITSVENITQKQSFGFLQAARSAYSGCGRGGARSGCGGSGQGSGGCGGGAPAVSSNNSASGNVTNNLNSGGSCCSLPQTVQ